MRCTAAIKGQFTRAELADIVYCAFIFASIPKFAGRCNLMSGLSRFAELVPATPKDRRSIPHVGSLVPQN